MREKYIEEDYPRYFVFGTSASGKVDIASVKNDTIATVNPEQADYIIKDRDKVLDVLCEMAILFSEVNPEEFREYWYGKRKRLESKSAG